MSEPTAPEYLDLVRKHHEVHKQISDRICFDYAMATDGHIDYHKRDAQIRKEFLEAIQHK